MCCAIAPGEICAQSQPAQSQTTGGQNAPAQTARPASNKQTPAAAPSNSDNPFPENENTVPVMPNRNTINQPADLGSAAGLLPLPGFDVDPVHSPDDGIQDTGSGSSSSLSGLDAMEPDADTSDTTSPPPAGKRGRHQDHNQGIDEPEHQESAAEDESVGKYYLDNKDWKGALSRYESALVLDPDNPDVYWGLAECERHLGRFADARANYQKVVEYDPGSHHAKEASKALKEPEIANASANTPSQPASRQMP